MSQKRVVVIGAGIAGLTAARSLKEGGCQVTVLERAGRPGGRLAPLDLDGTTVDPGGHVFSTADRHLLHLIQHSGLGARLIALGPPGLAQSRDGRLHPLDPSSRLGASRVPGVRTREALRLMRLDRLMARYAPHLDADAPERGAPLDSRSLTDFARLYFGQSVADRWIGPFATCGTLNRAEEASRLLYLLRARSHAYASPATLAGGVAGLPGALARRLDVRSGAKVVAVEAGPDGGWFVRFEKSEDQTAGTLSAEAVLFATTADVTSQLAPTAFGAAECDFLAGVDYAQAISLSVLLERRPWTRSQRLLVPHAEGAPLEAVTLAPDAAIMGLPERGGVVVGLATDSWSQAHAGVSDEVVAKDLLTALDRLQPGIRSAVAGTRVTRWAQAQVRFDVGYFRRLERFRRVQLDRRSLGRRLYFAGDYLAGPSLEGAASSGRRAAADLLEDLADA